VRLGESTSEARTGLGSQVPSALGLDELAGDRGLGDADQVFRTQPQPQTRPELAAAAGSHDRQISGYWGQVARRSIVRGPN
jgi:hypothetical protein